MIHNNPAPAHPDTHTTRVTSNDRFVSCGIALGDLIHIRRYSAWHNAKPLYESRSPPRINRHESRHPRGPRSSGCGSDQRSTTRPRLLRHRSRSGGYRMSVDREDSMMHVHEREEARDAARFAPPASCYRHDYKPNGRGGGQCIDCGDTISRQEL